MTFDVQKIRKDFPILHQKFNGWPLVYLDSGATSQKPQSVIDAVHEYYSYQNANIHRGIHRLSERATFSYEAVREKVKNFIHAARSEEIVFVRGTTEAINLVAQCYARPRLKPGDEIIVTQMEHHANIVPWQLVCEQTGAVLKVVPIDDEGNLILEEYQRLLNSRTFLVAVTHCSNTLGTINPIKEMVKLAHDQNIPVLVDGAQAVCHFPVDVQELDCDFYAFSGHKLLGPTGIGVLYGKAKLLENMPPYEGGGNMIQQVSFSGKTTFKEIPHRFEAGTPHIAGVIGLGAAIDYINKLDRKAILQYEEELLTYATEQLLTIPGIRIIGTAKNKASILSFVLEGVHPHDLSTILNEHGIAIRAGHHCTMPLMERYNLPATARASFAFYNTREEIDALVAGLKKARAMFHV